MTKIITKKIIREKLAGGNYSTKPTFKKNYQGKK